MTSSRARKLLHIAVSAFFCSSISSAIYAAPEAYNFEIGDICQVIYGPQEGRVVEIQGSRSAFVTTKASESVGEITLDPEIDDGYLIAYLQRPHGPAGEKVSLYADPIYYGKVLDTYGDKKTYHFHPSWLKKIEFIRIESPEPLNLDQENSITPREYLDLDFENFSFFE